MASYENLLFARQEPLECASENASDYYGLGVRLGIYFSWLGGWLANAFLSSGISGAADTNTIFLFTLLIAMTNDSNRDTLFQIDGLILMHLCGGTIFGILSIWGYRTRLYKDYGPRAIGLFGSYGTHLRMMTSLAVSVFGLWFWTYGLTEGLAVMGPGDGVEPPNTNECSTLYTFFFAKVPAHGSIRYYYIVISALCSAYFGFMLLVSTLSACFTFESILGSLRGHWAGAAKSNRIARPIYVTGFTSGELSFIHQVLRVANLIWLLYSAATVEVTLNFNHMTTVLGKPENNALSLPGQLLPFLIGLFSFLRVCYALYVERWLDRNEPQTPLLPDLPSPGAKHGGIMRSASEYDKAQMRRSWSVRYLVAWLPWLSLLQHYDEQLEGYGISRGNTGLSQYAGTSQEKGVDMEMASTRLIHSDQDILSPRR